MPPRYEKHAVWPGERVHYETHHFSSGIGSTLAVGSDSAHGAPRAGAPPRAALLLRYMYTPTRRRPCMLSAMYVGLISLLTASLEGLSKLCILRDQNERSCCKLSNIGENKKSGTRQPQKKRNSSRNVETCVAQPGGLSERVRKIRVGKLPRKIK